MDVPKAIDHIGSTSNLFNRVRQRVFSGVKPTFPVITLTQKPSTPISEALPPLYRTASQDSTWTYMVETAEMRKMYNIFHQYAVKHSMTAEMKVARMSILEKMRFVLCNEKRRDEPPTLNTHTAPTKSKGANITPLVPLPMARATFVDAMSSELTLYLSRTISCITWFECPTALSSAVEMAAEEIESSPFLHYLSRRGPAAMMDDRSHLVTVAAWITATSPSWIRILICSAAGVDRALGRSQLRRELQVALELKETHLVAPAFAQGLERVAALRRRLKGAIDDAVQRMVITKRCMLTLEVPNKPKHLGRQSGKRPLQLRRILGIRSAVQAGYEYQDEQNPEDDVLEECREERD